MSMVDLGLVTEAQSWIHGVGVIEYVELENRAEFSDAINPYTETEVHFDRRDTHPEVPITSKGYGQRIEVQDEYASLFDYVFMQPFVETHQLG